MSGYTKNKTVSFEFEGDTPTMALGRLSRKDFLKLTPFFPEKSQEGDGLVKMTPSENVDFMEAVCAVLPRYVTDFAGLCDADGEELDFKTVLSETYFMTLVNDVVNKLFDHSNMGKKEDDLKNSGDQLENDTTG